MAKLAKSGFALWWIITFAVEANVKGEELLLHHFFIPLLIFIKRISYMGMSFGWKWKKIFDYLEKNF